jgi:3-oxoacyl-[acyl-carrier-protein] synthase II
LILVLHARFREEGVMLDERIVITGIGAISPLGTGKESFWQGLMEGRNAIREITAFDTSLQRTHRGGEVPDFDFATLCPDLDASGMGRAAQFTVAASLEALADAGLNWRSFNPARIGLSMGTAIGESSLTERITDLLLQGDFAPLREGVVANSVPDSITGNAARVLGIHGPINLLFTACAGGNFAMGHASDLLRSGLVDFMLAGGVDPISRVAYTGFNSMMAVAPERCQPFDRNRKGMVPAEGCAVAVMERESSARRRGVKIYAVLAGFGATNDAHHMTSPHPEARGAIRALEIALHDARIAAEEVDYISAHGTGTPANDKAETLAVKRVFGDRACHIPMSSIKSMIGHTMGAASSLEAVACLLAMERGAIPPTINYETPDPDCDLDYVPNVPREKAVRVAVSNAYALGGHCSTIVLRKAA